MWLPLTTACAVGLAERADPAGDPISVPPACSCLGGDFLQGVETLSWHQDHVGGKKRWGPHHCMFLDTQCDGFMAHIRPVGYELA